jgi:hypothetical protein
VPGLFAVAGFTRELPAVAADSGGAILLAPREMLYGHHQDDTES